MKNYISKGDRIEVPNATAAYTSGQLVTIGDLVGVAMNTTEIGQTATILISGVVEVPKATGVAVTFGAKIYHDTATGNATPTAGALKQAGIAVSAQASGDPVVKIRLMF